MEKKSLYRVKTGIFFALSFLLAALFAGAAFAESRLPEHKEGEVLVRMKTDGAGMAAELRSRGDMAGMAEFLCVETARKLKCDHALPDMYVLKLRAGEKIEDKLLELKNHPDVEYAQPNYIYRASQSPNDASFSQQWGLCNTGQAVNYGSGGLTGADISISGAWEVSTGSSGIIVAVIDTGIDYNHPDLAANLWTNPSPGPENDLHGINVVPTYSGGGISGDPKDDNGHGTHVAGIIGAAGNNGIGVVGVNWTTKIMGLKFLDSTGSGTDTGAIECIDYAIRMKKSGQDVRVINASWGGNPGEGVDTALESAIKSAGDNGILFVAAAGNESNDNDLKPTYPGSSKQPGVISVAATDNRDNLAVFSNFGNDTVDVAAPGVNILSTYPANKSLYRYLSGTSMATPYVSGLAALVLAKKPGLTVMDTRDLIMGSVDILGLPVRSGGRINAAKALANASDPQISLNVKQDGAYSVISASFDAALTPQYGKKVTFYRDGVPAGRALTGSETSANPGVAIKRLREPAPGTHTVYAVLANKNSPSTLSDASNYTIYPPEITSVNPPRAPVGSVITINGSWFGSSKGSVYLRAAGGASRRVAPLTWTDTAITFKLPKKPAGEYQIYNKTGTMTSAPSDFSIPLPAITALSQASAKAGTVITITGNYFGTAKGGILLAPETGGKSARALPLTWSDTSITFAVPARPAGAYKLGVRNAAGTSLRIEFSISF